MRAPITPHPAQPGRERAFTVKAVVLAVLLDRDGIAIREIREEIEAITGGIHVGHSAVFTAGKALEADGLVNAEKQPRASGGGPPTLVLSITERGRAVAEDMRQQAERLLYWPKLKDELRRRTAAE